MSENNQIIRDMIQRIAQLEIEQKRLASLRPLFNIANVSVDIALTTNQNNYDPSTYDVLYITTTGTITMSGIAGGVHGRMLFIHNLSGTLQLLHNSASSTSTNRIFTRDAATLSILNRETALLTYYVKPTGFWRVTLTS